MVALIAGLVLLAIGSELVVRAAARLARALAVPPLLIGLTVVAIGTSTPELVVGITASASGLGGLALGNIAGTNMVNLLLILGMSALMVPIALHLQVLRIDVPFMIAAAVALWLLALDGTLGRLDGAVLLVIAAAYTVVLVRRSRLEGAEVAGEFADSFGAPPPGRTRLALEVALLVVGLAIVVLGGDWLVQGAIEVARRFGVSDTLIGLTVVAIGTSAPELMIAVIATVRGERDVAVGNLLGSSIYNVVVILAVTCLVPAGGIAVERELLWIDLPLMIAVALACVPVFLTGRRVTRLEGGAFVAAYVIYLATMVVLRA